MTSFLISPYSLVCCLSMYSFSLYQHAKKKKKKSNNTANNSIAFSLTVCVTGDLQAYALRPVTTTAGLNSTGVVVGSGTGQSLQVSVPLECRRLTLIWLIVFPYRIPNTWLTKLHEITNYAWRESKYRGGRIENNTDVFYPYLYFDIFCVLFLQQWKSQRRVGPVGADASKARAPTIEEPRSGTGMSPEKEGIHQMSGESSSSARKPEQSLDRGAQVAQGTLLQSKNRLKDSCSWSPR